MPKEWKKIAGVGARKTKEDCAFWGWDRDGAQRCAGTRTVFWFGWICPRRSGVEYKWVRRRGMQEVFKKRRPTLKQQHVLTFPCTIIGQSRLVRLFVSSRERTNEWRVEGPFSGPASLHQISILALGKPGGGHKKSAANVRTTRLVSPLHCRSQPVWRRILTLA
jgi:hypothetical protein